MFINSLLSNPVFFVTVTVTVIASIVLHELAHGYAAIRLGDDTPRESGHMTLNPVVHMGWFSLVMLALFGIAFGAMPVTPSRFRGRFARARVAAAGPLTNLVLALASLTILGVWMRYRGYWGELGSPAEVLGQRVLLYAGFTNLGLTLFNLLPIPPLDGSTVLGDLVPPAGAWLGRPDIRQFSGFIMIGLLVVGDRAGLGIFDLASRVGLDYLNLLSGLGLAFR